METKNDIRAAIDNAKLMTRLSVIGAAASLTLLVLVQIISAVRGNGVGNDVFAMGTIPYALALLFSCTGIIYGMLASSAAQEREEKQLLENRPDNRALNVEEDVRFTAERSFENFRRFAPYVLAVLAALLTGGLLWLFFEQWGARLDAGTTAAPGNPLHAAVVAFILMLISVFIGAFFVGQSRLPAFRWLRPVGAWLIAGFGVMFAALASSLFANSNHLEVDGYLARIIFWIFVVLGAEFLTSFIIEFYRPRTLKESRPIFESKLLALFTEPGGVMRNIASTLDYQFGFKVSGTWLYSFLERSFFPLVIVWLVILWGFTMIHEVGPSEVGVRERLGRVTSTEVLEPGIYWTLPWPFGQVNTYSCTEIQQVVIGELHGADEEEDEVEDDGHGHAKAPKREKSALSQVVLWTGAHGSDDNNFIVAVPPEDGKSDVDSSSISFIRMVIPIQYRIRRDGVMDFAYKNADPVSTLKRIGEQAATEFLASTSMMEVMSEQRSAAQQAMKNKIQQMADAHQLGVEIVGVLILDAHPPVEKVAPAYQNVIGAMEEMETAILRAESYAVTTRPDAETRALRIVQEAKAYEYMVKTVAGAESARFQTQLITYNAMPSMFRLKAYLDFLEQDCKDIRKYIVASGLKSEVYQLNFEEKERVDLYDTNIAEMSGN